MQTELYCFYGRSALKSSSSSSQESENVRVRRRARDNSSERENPTPAERLKGRGFTSPPHRGISPCSHWRPAERSSIHMSAHQTGCNKKRQRKEKNLFHAQKVQVEKSARRNMLQRCTLFICMTSQDRRVLS